MLGNFTNKHVNEFSHDIDGLVQDCIANALEILQSCTKPSIYDWKFCFWQALGPGLIEVMVVHSQVLQLLPCCEVTGYRLLGYSHSRHHGADEPLGP